MTGLNIDVEGVMDRVALPNNDQEDSNLSDSVDHYKLISVVDTEKVFSKTDVSFFPSFCY